MEYLVESHMGGYYISDLDPKIITAFCESCGDSDWILLSWEKGNMMEALTQYFSKIRYSAEYIETERQIGITKQEYIENILYDYSFDNKNVIESLFSDNYIAEEEYKKLLKINLQAQKEQISLVCNIYPKEVRKVLKKKS